MNTQSLCRLLAGSLLVNAALSTPGAEPGSTARTSSLTVTPAQLAARASAYQGRELRVKSGLAEALGPHVFVLADQGRRAEVLVLIPVLRPYALGAGLVEEDRGIPVTVRGTARLFDRQQFESDYAWFSVNLFRNPDYLAEWEGRPVIIARSVRTPSGRELVDREASGFEGNNQAPRTRMENRDAPVRFDRPISDVRALFAVDDVRRLLRMRVLLENVQVQRVLNPRWVMVGTPGEQQVLVRLPRRHRRVQIGDAVEVSGVIRQMPASPWTLGLTDDQLALAERPEIYIYADDVER